jgi:DNA-binding XRE family transcriptional regulator
MIKNERAYKVAKAAASRFQRALAAHEAKPAGDDPIGHGAEIAALRAQLRDLGDQVTAYKALRAGGIKTLTAATVQDLPALLIQARIACGLTHAQLAERLDVKPQQIQRWEDDDYQSAAFWRLADIADALGLSVTIRAKPFRAPSRLCLPSRSSRGNLPSSRVHEPESSSRSPDQ